LHKAASCGLSALADTLVSRTVALIQQIQNIVFTAHPVQSFLQSIITNSELMLLYMKSITLNINLTTYCYAIFQVQDRNSIFAHNQVNIKIAILLAQTFDFDDTALFLYDYIKISKQFFSVQMRSLLNLKLIIIIIIINIFNVA